MPVSTSTDDQMACTTIARIGRPVHRMHRADPSEQQSVLGHRVVDARAGEHDAADRAERRHDHQTSENRRRAARSRGRQRASHAMCVDVSTASNGSTSRYGAVQRQVADDDDAGRASARAESSARDCAFLSAA